MILQVLNNLQAKVCKSRPRLYVIVLAILVLPDPCPPHNSKPPMPIIIILLLTIFYLKTKNIHKVLPGTRNAFRNGTFPRQDRK